MATRTKWVAGGGLILVAAICGGVFAGWWTFHHVDAHLQLRDQPVTVRLPGEMPVKAEILNDLDIVIDGKIKTRVPVDQTLSLPIRNTLHVDVGFDHDVPIVMTVPIHAVIPVDQLVHVDSQVRVTVLGQDVTLPVRGDVPIKTEVPVNLDVPVNQEVHLKFTAPAEVTLDQPLKVPLKADIDTTIPIHSRMSVPVRSALQAVVEIPQPVDAVITQADLNLPLHSLRIGLARGAGAPAAAVSAPAPAAGGAQ